MTTDRANRPRLIAAAVLATAGAVALGASILLSGTSAIELSRANAPVSGGARNPGDIRANNSPTLAANPLRPDELAVVNRIDTPAYGCALHVSRDHGSHWSAVAIPIPPGEERKCFAPDVAFGADGTLYVSYVTLRGTANEPHALWVAHSADGGRTLRPPVRASGPLAFQARLTTDPRRPKRVYLTWLQPETVGLYLFGASGNRIDVSRSDDGGQHWRTPVPASDQRRQRVLAPSPLVGPDGAIYVLYLDVGDDRLDYEAAHAGFGGPPYHGRFTLVLGRSADGGATWQESVVDDRIAPTRRFLAFLPPSPSLAIDRQSGRLYAAFEDATRSPSDVHVWSLARGASRWDGPVQVNDTPEHDGTSQYLPAIAVAPNGRLDVVYYDRRDDPSNRRNEVSAQSSFDHGRSFTASVPLTDRDFDSGVGAGSERRLPDLGSRLGVVSEPSSLLAVWTDTRAGTVGSNKQDIALAVAAVRQARLPSASARTALRSGGIALLAGAAALLFLTRVRPRGR